MSAIFGRSRAQMKPAATGLSLQTSSNAVPVPIIYGRGRVAPNLVWYDGFKARKVKVGGGKGGSSQKAWKYSVSVILGLCEGPINDVNNVWRNLFFKDTGTSFKNQNNAVEFLGTYAQNPWPYLVSQFPSAALAYRGLAYLGLPVYDLGDSPQMPQHSCEINGILYDTGIGGTVPDADPALLIQDFLTNALYGTPFRASALDTDALLSGPNATTTGDSAYQTYCRALGFSLSPELINSEEASSILQRWAMLTNSALVWSGSKLKVIPYGNEQVTANGVTYIPDTAVRYDLTRDDFQYDDGEDPVVYRRGDPADAKNAFYLKVSDRSDDYAIKPVGARDQSAIEKFGKLQADTIEASEIKTLQMGDTLAHLILQRSAYVRNVFSFRLDQRFVRLEAMDVITLTEPSLGLVQYRVRINSITENEDGQFEVEAEDFPEGLGSTSSYNSQSSENTILNANEDPGNVETPVIFEVPSILTNGLPQIWMGITGAGSYWGGAEVWLSTDNADYYLVGEVQNEMRMGVLGSTLPTYVSTNPDNTNTLDVDLSTSLGQLDSGTAFDAANGITLCYVDGELISYQTATLTSQYNYDLTVLYRALYGSTVGAHLAGSQFLRLDDAVFKYDLPQEFVGETLYIKLVSFNFWGASLQDISTLSPYTITPTGVAWTLNPPASVTLTPVSTTLPDGSTTISLEVTWPSSAGQLIDRYDVQVEVNGTGSWVSAPAAPGDSLISIFNNALANTDYRARVRAVRTSGQAITSAFQESSVVNSGGTSSSVPSAASAVSATGSLGGILVRWTGSSSSSVLGYKVYAVNNHSGAFGASSLVGTVSRGTLEFFHAGLASAALWRYWVVAYNGTGDATEAGPADGTVSTAGGGGVDVEDEGVAVVTASTLNFVGAGVTATDVAGVATVTIPGGGGGGSAWTFVSSTTIALWHNQRRYNGACRI
jgi:hypothetical protein